MTISTTLTTPNKYPPINPELLPHGPIRFDPDYSLFGIYVSIIATTLKLDYIRLKSKPLERRPWDSTVGLCHIDENGLCWITCNTSTLQHHAMPYPDHIVSLALGNIAAHEISHAITFHDFCGVKDHGAEWEMVMKTVMGVVTVKRVIVWELPGILKNYS